MKMRKFAFAITISNCMVVCPEFGIVEYKIESRVYETTCIFFSKDTAITFLTSVRSTDN